VLLFHVGLLLQFCCLAREFNTIANCSKR
jgi:hypothetical protein